MQRFLRKVGKLSSSKSKHEGSVGESRVIIGGGGASTGTSVVVVDPAGQAPEAKTLSPPALPRSSVTFANGTTTTRKPADELPVVFDENLFHPKSSQTKKKRNSLIESFRRLKRHSRSKDVRRSVPGIGETVSLKANHDIKPEVVAPAAAVCESEPTADDQCPSTREVSVNGDVTSLSLSVLTLRSLGSAEASAGHAFSRLDASSEVVEDVSSDIGRAEFLAKEVPGPAAPVSDPGTLLASTPGNVGENQVSLEFSSILFSSPLAPTCVNSDSPSHVVLSSSSVLLTDCTVQLSSQLPANVFAATELADIGDDDDDDDNSGEDGSRIHDTLPVNLLYSPVELGNDCSGADDAGRLSDKTVVLSGTSALASTDQDDCSSSGTENGKWSLMHELTQLSRHGWYWGPISREEAEEKLTDQPEGAFLIRDSTDERYLFSLSFRSFNRTLHTRIEYCNGEFSFYHLPHSEGYKSLIDLIENAIHDSLNGIFYYSRSNAAGSHSYAVKLTKPVSRFTQVRSLQYLCRFIIRQHTRVDHIQNLPLPMTVKSWLRENQY